MAALTTDFTTIVVELDSNAVFEYDKNNLIKYRTDVGMTKPDDIKSIMFKNGKKDLKTIDSAKLTQQINTFGDKVKPRAYDPSKSYLGLGKLTYAMNTKFKETRDLVIGLINATDENGAAILGKIPLKGILIYKSDLDQIDNFFMEKNNLMRYQRSDKSATNVKPLTAEYILSEPKEIYYVKEDAKTKNKDALDLYNFLSALAETRVTLNAAFADIMTNKTVKGAVSPLMPNWFDGKNRFDNFKTFISKTSGITPYGTYDKKPKYKYFENDADADAASKVMDSGFNFDDMKDAGHIGINEATYKTQANQDDKNEQMIQFAKDFEEGVQKTARTKRQQNGGKKSRKTSKGGRKRRKTRSSKKFNL